MLKVLNILQYQMSSKELVLYAKEKKNLLNSLYSKFELVLS